ncbi:hypothetical protein GCM10022284_27240 [Streptomyces hundungensis]
MGVPLALKALGEFEDERPSGANGGLGAEPPGAGTKQPRATGGRVGKLARAGAELREV